MPALVVGIDVPAVAEAGIVTVGTTRVRDRRDRDADEVQAFPGMRRGSPAMFVAASALEDLGLSTRVRETWIRGERAEILSHAGRGEDELRGDHNRRPASSTRCRS